MNEQDEIIRPVVIESYTDAGAADRALLNLLAAGIKAELQSDDCAGMQPFLHAANGISVVVESGLEAEALAVLAEMKAELEADKSVEGLPQKRLFLKGFIVGFLIALAVVYLVHLSVMGEGPPVAIIDGMDRNEDGKEDVKLTYGANGSVESVASDENFDGKMDQWVSIDTFGYTRQVERDLDFNGVIDATINYRLGIVEKVIVRPNNSPRGQRESFYENGVLVSEVFDQDGDGELDSRIQYDCFGTVVSESKL